jgi:DNA-3-methyladenine glycosylase
VKLPVDFYRRDDVVRIGQELLGKVLCTRIDGSLTSAVITETEAYAGVEDRASHAFRDRRTPRTEPMYGPGGIAYIYLCYGIHHLFNVVTGETGAPHAVLIRAGQPLDGVDVIRARRGGRDVLPGPGTVSQALGIHTSMTGTDLGGDRIWIEDRGLAVGDIAAGPRIGVDYAGEDAGRPYRFVARSVAH